ncbi:MAG: GNAT family N-acetyltransferase [Planctomycetota bacterium]|jgi:ribosomal protein S18 acetylase RimI-like enzyme
MTEGDALVREARPDDASAMLRLWRLFWSPQPYESHLPEKIESDPDLVLVAELNGEVVGTAIGGFDGWWAWVYRVAVRPARQGMGIGTRLVQEMQARLRARGAASAGMVVDPRNEKMVGLLRKLGYRHDERHGVFGVRFVEVEGS